MLQEAVRRGAEVAAEKAAATTTKGTAEEAAASKAAEEEAAAKAAAEGAISLSAKKNCSQGSQTYISICSNISTVTRQHPQRSVGR